MSLLLQICLVAVYKEPLGGLAVGDLCNRLHVPLQTPQLSFAASSGDLKLIT